VLTGGVDANALQRPKRSSAPRGMWRRAVRCRSSPALIDTGSRMDEVIFEEFKGTGNSEIILDRKVADKRIFPAIDVLKSGTRKEELITRATSCRRPMSCAASSTRWRLGRHRVPAEKMRQSKTNGDFFQSMNT